MDTKDKLPVKGLYAIADSQVLAPASMHRAVAQAIDGGAGAIQYRDKGGDPARRQAQARALVQLCRTYQVPLIINDDVQLAQAVEADGVHLGRDDAALTHARQTLGHGAIIGVSCYNNLPLAVAAQAQGADYVAFGSFFPSPTKPDAVRADVQLLRQARAQLHCAIVAIGGITPDNGAALVTAGADALAVIHGVFAQPDPMQAAQRYAALFQPPSQQASSS